MRAPYPYNSFEEYMGKQHSDEYPMVLDDDLPDSYDNWLAEIKRDDILKFANNYVAFYVPHFDMVRSELAEGITDRFIKENY